MSEKENIRERRRMQNDREELVERIGHAVSGEGLFEVFPGLFLARVSAPSERTHSVFTPAFCIIVQGSKQVLLGEELFQYDPGHYLIATVDLPIVSYVTEASQEKPYLSFMIDLDPTLVAEVLMESEVEMKKADASVKAMDVSPIDADLLGAVVKLIRLLDKPDELKFLKPLIMRELIYRLLRSNQGARLGHLLTSEGDTRRISKAVEHLREKYDEPFIAENIARDLGMSVSGFHHHFKSVTAMSPLQFQKQIRLQEARRLMLGENLDVSSASFRVGYEDPSYFTREYKKLFGVPPLRDIAELRSNLSQ